MVLPVRHFKAPELVPITRVAQVNGPGKRKKERCLSYDEKPLLLFQKLKDACKNPVFMLKHINDVSSAVQPPTPPRPSKQESSDNRKSFKVRLEDSVWKVLPAALRKYRINYVMICYGPPSTSF